MLTKSIFSLKFFLNPTYSIFGYFKAVNIFSYLFLQILEF